MGFLNDLLIKIGVKKKKYSIVHRLLLRFIKANRKSHNLIIKPINLKLIHNYNDIEKQMDPGTYSAFVHFINICQVEYVTNELLTFLILEKQLYNFCNLMWGYMLHSKSRYAAQEEFIELNSHIINRELTKFLQRERRFHFFKGEHIFADMKWRCITNQEFDRLCRKWNKKIANDKFLSWGINTK